MKALKDFLVTVLIAVVLALALKFFIIDSCKILSESMATTLNTGDRILVFRLAYTFDDIERGDIIIFDPPAEMDEGVDFIKRIIGLPGETVEVKNGVGVFINGELLEEDYIREIPQYDFGPLTVPDDSVIVFGDNRNASADSHYWSDPFLPIEDINGKAILKYYPFSDIGLFKDSYAD